MDYNNGINVNKDTTIGEVKIADEVITVIAAIAATDTKGVAKLYGNITNDLVSKLGFQKLSKGIRTKVVDGKVAVDLSLELEYGVSIKSVSERVQERVKSAIENMTGLEVTEVNIRIAGVSMEEE
ncbi:MAG: Asp23/Gls24 family envelope stress response protein [Lachnospiraceae bacterium]|nr:Asp23/Gls24 family envelope stress response protein [Lachnospiraceae bacterium]